MSRALGRYELLRPLARGGMGEVYLARRRAAGVEKWLVVKRMRPERVGDARFLDLFKREAKLSMSLAHQNIVPVFDFGRIDDQVFLAMERVEGKDLGSTLARAGKPLPAVLAAFVAAECCQALDYAHRRKGPDGTELGIVHRDVTPRNVLLSWSGEVKLTDFGIAALASDQSSKMAGTPAYMAPEQARGEPLDPRADVFAVGMVLREALTGERPRKGSDRESTVVLAQEGKLDDWPPGFDSPLKSIVDRATAADKQERFPDARSMLEALDEFIVGERSGKKSDAPARHLAAWLGEVWQGAREEEAIDDGKIEAGELLSFLDDGALDAMGTGTERSAAATAAEVNSEPVVEPPKPRGSAQTEVPQPPRGTTQTEGSPTAMPTPIWPRVDAQPAPRKTSKALLALLGLGVFATGSLVIWKLAGTQDAPPPAVAEPVLPEPIPPPPVHAVQPEDKPPVVEEHEPIVEEHKPVVGDHEPVVDKKPKQKQPTQKHPKQVGSAAAVVEAPAVAKRKVTINAQPWSYFTVDNDKTQHQTLANLELTPGPHKIHFTGSEWNKADKTITITVPDNDGFKIVENLEPPAPPTRRPQIERAP